MWEWIKKHPQRTAGLALTVIGGIQTNLSLVMDHFPPLIGAVTNMVFGTLVATLGWMKSNAKDEP